MTRQEIIEIIEKDNAKRAERGKSVEVRNAMTFGFLKGLRVAGIITSDELDDIYLEVEI